MKDANKFGMIIWIGHSPYLQWFDSFCQCILGCIYSCILRVDWCTHRHFGINHLSMHRLILHTVCLCTQCCCNHRCNFLPSLCKHLRFCTDNCNCIGTCHQSILGHTDTWRIILSAICIPIISQVNLNLIVLQQSNILSNYLLEVVLIVRFSMLTGTRKELCNIHQLLLYFFAQMFYFLF